MKRKLILLFLVCLIFISCSVSNNKVQSGAAGTGIVVGSKAPDFTLRDIDGREVKLSDYRGKVVILNFFGVWCGWCQKEMPGFVNVYNQYKGKDVVLLVVDVYDTKDKLEKYLKENNFDIKPAMDAREKVVRKYDVSGFPSTFILDGDGVIKAVHRQYMDENTLISYLKPLVQ